MDIIKDVVAHLSADLGVRVASQRPANPGKRMVTVRRVGGGGSVFRDNPLVEVTAWEESDVAAYKLAELAADSMFTLPAFSANVAEVTRNSFRSDTFMDGTPRWTGVYVIVCNR